MKREYIDTINSSGIFKNIPREKTEEVLEELNCHIKEYDKGKFVSLEGEYDNKMGIVVEGALCTGKNRENGDAFVIDIYEKGYCFGVENAVSQSKINPVSIYALRKSVVCMLTVEEILGCSMKDLLVSNLLHLLADEGIRKMYKVDILSRQGIRERIMTFLLTMSSIKNSDSFKINMSQEQFAQYLAVNRSTLASEINNMRREGIIDFKRDYFTILKK